MWRYINLTQPSNVVRWAEEFLCDPPTPGEKLKLYDWQKDVLNCRHKYRLIIHGRRVGATTVMLVDVLHKVITEDGTKVLIIATNPTSYINKYIAAMLNIGRDSHEGTKELTINSWQIQCSNDSEILIVANGIVRDGWLHGRRFDHVYCDNAAFVNEDAINAILTLYSGKQTTLLVVSTPRGYGDQINDWACSGDSPFRCGTKDSDCSCGGSPFHVPVMSSEAYYHHDRCFVAE